MTQGITNTAPNMARDTTGLAVADKARALAGKVQERAKKIFGRKESNATSASALLPNQRGPRNFYGTFSR